MNAATPGTGPVPGRNRVTVNRPGRSVVSVILFLALGLAAAFIVSALAGVWEPEGTGTAFDPGLSPDEAAEIRVEVLNGSGGPGLARNATRQLRGAGFDVVYFGNARRFDHSRSMAVDRAGHIERARAVAAALGIDSVVTAVDSTLLLEVTIVLGEDWPPRPGGPLGSWSDRLRDRFLENDPGDSAGHATEGSTEDSTGGG